jgi:hypothetical protein
MRPILFVALAVALTAAGAPFSIVRTIISDTDGGAALPASFEHVPGETLFFSCRIAGYQKTPEEKIHLAYTVEAFDPQGVPVMESFHNEITDEVSPQDKEWMPKIQTEIPLPPLAASGAYKIVVQAEDLVAKTKTETSVPFEVRGHRVDPSDTLTVRNFQFFRSEDDTEAVAKPIYRPGDAVWAKFDITGFRYGPKNKIDVSYITSVLRNSGEVLWKQPEAAAEQTESFYPKRYVPASMGINLQKDIAPGDYTIDVQVTDAVGGQTYDTKAMFTVE